MDSDTMKEPEVEYLLKTPVNIAPLPTIDLFLKSLVMQSSYINTAQITFNKM